jgi:AcrR family transcriptional regulator
VPPSERPATSSTADELVAATERLLVSGGHAGISTRRVAEEAGQPHGLVRYHFGTLEGLMLRTLEAAAARIIDRQRELYAGDRPFLEKWRTAMGHVDTDIDEGFPKLTAEMFAKAWNEPVYRDGVRRTMEAFTEMLAEAVSIAAEEYGEEVDDDEVLALATLVRTFQIGMLVERLAGVDVGHAELLAIIDRLLVHRHEGGGRARPAP